MSGTPLHDNDDLPERGPLYIVGAGGHARVVVDAALAEGRYDVVGIIDDRVALHGSELLGVPIVSSLDSFLLGRRAGVVVIAIGDNHTRSAIAARVRYAGYAMATVVHPRATVSPFATLGSGTVVIAGAVVAPQAKVGNDCIINTGASVDHDCTLGHGVHCAPGARLCGAVTVGDGAFVAAGATVIPGRNVGAWAIVGAGATVVSDIPARTTVVGTPARPLQLRSKEGE